VSEREKKIAEIREALKHYPRHREPCYEGNKDYEAYHQLEDCKLEWFELLLSELAEKEAKLNQAVEALKTIMYHPRSHPHIRIIADNALQSIKGGESDD